MRFYYAHRKVPGLYFWLQALEFNLSAWESGETLRADAKQGRKKGAMMPQLASPPPPLRERNSMLKK